MMNLRREIENKSMSLVSLQVAKGIRKKNDPLIRTPKSDQEDWCDQALKQPLIVLW